MNVPLRNIFAASTLAVLLSGCGGGGGGSSAPAPRNLAPTPSGSSQPSPSASAGPSGNAQFTITVPAKSSSSAHRRAPKEISPSARGMSISVTSSTGPGASQNYVLSSTAPGCSANSDGSFTCAVGIPAPAGNDTFTVNIYDQSNFFYFDLANLLGTGTAQATITEAQANTVNITIDGVPNSVQLMVANTTPPVGSALTQPLTVNAYDADGNLITGTYSTPVTLTTAGSGLTLSTTSVASSTTPVTVTYSGANVFRADVYVPAPAVTGNVTPSSPTGDLIIQPGGPRYIDIVSQGSNAVYRYSLDGVTETTIAGSNTHLNDPTGVAVDPNGTIFVSNDGCIITSYAAGATGNVTPATTVEPTSGCYGGLAADGTDVYAISYNTQALEMELVAFPETTNGAISPALTESSGYGTTNSATYIAEDASHDVAFTVQVNGSPTIATFPVGTINKTLSTTSNQTAVVLTGGSALANRNVVGIAFSPAGDLVVSSYDPAGATPNSFEEFAPFATGSALPQSQIASTALPGGGIVLTIDPAGYIYDYAPYANPAAIIVYAPGMTGNVAPLQTLNPPSLPASSSSSPYFGGIAVH